VALLALFVLVTGPTAAHAIARAAADAGIEPWTRANATDHESDSDALVADGGRSESTEGDVSVPRDPQDPEAKR